MPTLGDDERRRVTGNVAGLYEFTDEGARARRLLLQQSGLGRFVVGTNLSGSAIIVAADILSKVEDFGVLPEFPTKTALGSLLSYLLTLNELPQAEKKFMAGLILTHSLVTDPLYLQKLQKEYELAAAMGSKPVVTPVVSVVPEPKLPGGGPPIVSETDSSEPAFVVELTDKTGLESIINSEDNFLDISWLFGALYSAQAVCRIEIPEGKPKGTGFLIAPDLVLTNHHVLRNKGLLERVSMRFDYRVDSTGVASAGRVFKLNPEFYYESEPKKLDYALVQLESAPLEAIRVQDPNPSLMDFVLKGQHRGYLILRSELIIQNDRVNIIQHPGGDPMKAVLTQNYVAKDMSETRVQYVADTMPGSSGSPVFNSKWEVVALHHSGTPYPPESVPANEKQPWKGEYRVNEGIPMRAILADLRAQGLEHLLPRI